MLGAVHSILPLRRSLFSQTISDGFVRFTTPPESQAVLPGLDATLHCQVNSSLDVHYLRVRWLLDDTEISPTNGSYRVEKNGFRLRVLNITDQSQLGVYRCEVTTNVGIVLSSSATIRLIGEF